MSRNEWLLFTALLPTTPSSLRVSVWRRLRHSGATNLQNGVWILPRTEENMISMERLLGYVRQSEASGHMFLVQELNQTACDDIVAQFNADRNQEYDEFLEQCELFISEINKETRDKKFTFAELEENEQNLQRLNKWIRKIQKRDFFNSSTSTLAVNALQECQSSLQNYTEQVYIQEGIGTASEER